MLFWSLAELRSLRPPSPPPPGFGFPSGSGFGGGGVGGRVRVGGLAWRVAGGCLGLGWRLAAGLVGGWAPPFCLRVLWVGALGSRSLPLSPAAPRNHEN